MAESYNQQQRYRLVVSSSFSFNHHYILTLDRCAVQQHPGQRKHKYITALHITERKEERVAQMPSVMQKSLATKTFPVLKASWEASKMPLPHASFSPSRLSSKSKREKPCRTLPVAMFFTRVLPEDRSRTKPSRKFVTCQFLTVTPVLRMSRMPLPEPGPVTLWPPQSRVMSSVPMMILP